MSKQHWNRSESIEAFTEHAGSLLASLCAQRVKLEEQNPDKAASTITRKLGPYRDQLQVDLLNAATNAPFTSGEWVLFPKADDLPRVWRRVAEATAEGRLGPTSKVGTFEPQNLTKGTLICVYTYDFPDLDDVKRVLCTLYDLNILRRDVPVYYKCDAYTHLGIFSDNQYKLRASLYSSEEVFNDKVKYTDGVIVRLQKRNGSIGGFFS